MDNEIVDAMTDLEFWAMFIKQEMEYGRIVMDIFKKYMGLPE